MKETETSEPASDDELMQRFCDGDEAAFGRLYDRFAPELAILLRRFVRDEALAEDLLQTTFLSFVRARGRYVPSVSPRAWVFTIAANAARDALRRRATRREDAVPPEVLNNVQSPAAPLSDPQMAAAVETALQQLPVDQREAVLLHKLHGLSFPEVAAAMGTTVGAVKVRAHRGYLRRRVLLAHWEHK